MTNIAETLSDTACMLSTCLKTYLDNGIHDADISQVKETTDAIKDLAEAKYYCVVTEAMEKGEEYPYGYVNWDLDRRDHNRYGYNPNMYKPMVDQEPYIRDYMDWKNAKRHYTETHSMKDKDDMNDNSVKVFNNFIKNVKEMYGDADISTKQEMKSDLMTLINNL